MKTLFQNLFRRRDARRGNAMLEFAVGSAVLLSAFTGTYKFGYAFYRYNTLVQAVSNAAYYGAQRTYETSSQTPTNAFTTAVQNMAVYGNPSGGTTPVAPGLTTSNVNLTVAFTNNVPISVTVSISGYSLDALFNSSTLTGKPRATYPYTGLYTP